MDISETIDVICRFIGSPENAIYLQDFQHISVPDIYHVWDEFNPTEQRSIFFRLDVASRVDLVCLMTPEDQETLISSLHFSNMKEIFANMEPDDLVDIIQQLAPDVRSSVWNSLSDEARRETLFLLRFDETEAAGIMTPRYLAIRTDLLVQQTISFVRTTAPKVQNISYIYVLDNLNRLQGIVSLRKLMGSEDDTLISSIMKTDIISVGEQTDQEIVASLLESHDLLALPVLDSYGRLLGIVTIDDAINVIRDEQTEDVYKMGAMGGSTDQYLKTSVFGLVKKRMPWLALLLFAGTLTTNMLGLFDDVIRGSIFLFWFIPVIMQTGGNTSVQSSTLMIRGLSRHELSFRNIWQILRREFFVALVLGLLLGLLIILRSSFITPTVSMHQSLILGLALSLVVIFASIIGVLAPLCIHRLGYDPTVMTGPLMATFIDVVGLAIYFLIAQAILAF